MHQSVMECLNQILDNTMAHLGQCSISPDAISARMVPSRNELTSGAVSAALAHVDEIEFDREFEELLAKYAPEEPTSSPSPHRMLM
jgi:hypothetical protein